MRWNPDCYGTSHHWKLVAVTDLQYPHLVSGREVMNTSRRTRKIMAEKGECIAARELRWSDSLEPEITEVMSPDDIMFRRREAIYMQWPRRGFLTNCNLG